jgi:hypothetical protein
MEDDAVFLMQCAHKIAHVRPKHALHRPLLRRHHMDLDIARTQCRRGFEPNETRANHNRAACTFCGFNDRPAIRKRA